MSICIRHDKQMARCRRRIVVAQHPPQGFPPW